MLSVLKSELHFMIKKNGKVWEGKISDVYGSNKFFQPLESVF